MKRLACLLAVAYVPVCFATASAFEESASRYIGELVAGKGGVFFASCNTDGGRAILILRDGKQGKYVEMRDSTPVNMADVLIKKNRLQIDFAQTNGGAYSFSRAEARIKELSEMDFRLAIESAAIEAILAGRSERTCTAK